MEATINEVIRRVQALHPEAWPDEAKAAWLMELEGKLYREVILTHELDEGAVMPEYPTSWPEDGDKPLLAQAPYDQLYDAYLVARMDLENRDVENYNASATVATQLEREWRLWYHKTHMPITVRRKGCRCV